MVAIAVATLLVSPAPPASPAAAGTLKYVVIVARHGVRAPTWTNDRLNEYTVAPWPEWHVAPGNLTPRGRSLTKLMGGYYAAWLSSEGLIRRTGCQDANRIFIWADTDERTLETGRAIAEGLMPACTIAVHSLREGEADPLFDPISSGHLTLDAERAAAAIREHFEPPGTVIAPLRSTFQALQRVLGQPTSASKILTDPSSAVGVTITKGAVELTGPLDIASTFTENLLLEYANGMEGTDLGWGRLDADTLLRIMRLHTAYADLMRRTPLLARARSSNLLAHILHSMEQAVGGTHADGAVGEVGDRVLFLSGHDTNLSNLSGMLNLSWRLPGTNAMTRRPEARSLWRCARTPRQKSTS